MIISIMFLSAFFVPVSFIIGYEVGYADGVDDTND